MAGHAEFHSYTVALAIVFWYASSAICNSTSKEILSYISSPFLLSSLQFFISLSISCICLKHFNGYFLPDDLSSQDQVKLVLLVSSSFTVGFACVNGGHQVMHVSINETLRALEPLFSVILSFLWIQDILISRKRIMSLFPIVFGVALSSYSNADFNFFGFGLAVLANISFSCRSVFTKKLRRISGVNHLDLFHYTLRFGTLVQCVGLVMKQFIIGSSSSSISITPRVIGLIFVNGSSFYAYNQLSFYVLEKTHIVTHAIGNAFRRVVTIIFAIGYFGLSVTPLNALGMVIAATGVYFYGKALAEDSKQKAELKHDPENELQ